MQIFVVYVIVITVPTLARSELPTFLNSSDTSLFVRSPAGTFLGYGGTSYSGKFFASFSGIRYAEAPVGQLRFKSPVPYEYDKDHLVTAYTEIPYCKQIRLNYSEIIGEEDCLFLNIYTPNVTGEAPVIVYVFGGAFRAGTTSRRIYGPEYFMDENVVLVAINFRLGPLGYASTEDDAIPGNYGQEDQVEAVRWVARNIKHFGGDPDNLTLMGHSSGASSVALQLKSPQMKHLIKRGIVQSASSLNNFAFSREHRVRNKTIELASLLGCPKEPVELASCLRASKDTIILEKSKGIPDNAFDLAPLRPVLNKKNTRKDFTVNIPLLIGFVETESSTITNILATALGTTIPDLMLQVKANFSASLIHILTLNTQYPHPEVEAVARAMAGFYWGGNNDTSYSYDNILSVLKALSDIQFTYPVYREAQISTNDVYTYLFSFNSPTIIATNPAAIYGTSHADELGYFFNDETIDLRNVGSESDRRMSKLLVKMWTDFASGRNPTPELDWSGTSRQGGYLEISNSGLGLVDVRKGNTEMAQRLQFWANLLGQQIGGNTTKACVV